MLFKNFYVNCGVLDFQGSCETSVVPFSGQLYCTVSTDLTYFTCACCSHLDMSDTIALTHMRKELGTCSLPY